MSLVVQVPLVKKVSKMAVSTSTQAKLRIALADAGAGNEVADTLNQFLSGVYTVATIPAASSSNEGYIAFISNGAGGNPTLAVSDGTNWLRSDTLATCAAS